MSIRNLTNPICRKYSGRINSHIAAGEATSHHYKSALLEQKITESAKIHLGIDPNRNLSMFDFVSDSYEILPTLRFIYLCSSFEAFSKEYIAFRESIPIFDYKSKLSNETRYWKSNNSGFKASESLCNTEFSSYVLSSKYGIDFSSVTYPTFWEMGAIRNCIIHHDGEIVNNDFVTALPLTLSRLGLSPTKNQKLHIDEKFIWDFIEGSRQFILACDY